MASTTTQQAIADQHTAVLKRLHITPKQLRGSAFEPGVPLYKQLTDNALGRLKHAALTDLPSFAALINFQDGLWNFDEVHFELMQLVSMTDERRLVLMPRGHLKSTICSTLYVMWRIYQNPNIRILVGSATKELATGFVREVMQYFEDPELQQYVWNVRPHYDGALVPDLDRSGSSRKRNDNAALDDSVFGGEITANAVTTDGRKVIWRSNALQVNRTDIMKEPTLYATSVGVMVTGQHYDLVIFDDIVTFRNSDSLLKANKIYSWVMDIESVINTRGAKGHPDLGGESVILGTFYYKWDFYNKLLGNDLENEEDIEEYLETLADDPLYIIFRDILGNGCKPRQYNPSSPEEIGQIEDITGNTGYMCPRLMNAKLERKMRRRLGLRRFMSQYFNKIISDEGTILDWEKLKYVQPLQVTREQGMIAVSWYENLVLKEKAYIKPILVVDPAASLSEKADFTVILVGGKDYTGRVFLLDVTYGHFTVNRMAAEMKQMLQKWQLTAAYVETAAFQKSLIYSIKDAWAQDNFNAAIIEDRPTGDKKMNIQNTIEPLLESQRLHLMNWMAVKKALRIQFDGFPQEGIRDDFPDAVQKLVKYSRAIPPQVIDKKKRGVRDKTKVNSKYGGVR
jgi:predicted phage terminase large subunit-like protein